MKLAEMIGYDSATLGGLITRLIAKKIVARKVGKHDRRTRQLTLTARGNYVLQEALPRALAVEASLLSALAPDERELFISMLERVGNKAVVTADGSEAASA